MPLNDLGRFLVEAFPPEELRESSIGENNPRNDMQEMLSRQIRTELTEAGHDTDHHAIQNIVGPSLHA